jgi:hypothetical protein
MPKALMETTIDRPADEVWATIRGFAKLDWHPGIESCREEGDGRIAKMAGFGLEVDERLVHHDDEQRTYTYAVVGFRGDTAFDLGGGNVVDLSTMTDHHRATITVLPLDDDTSRVTYELELDPGHDEMFEPTSGQYQAVLDHLKKHMEG